MSNYEQRIKAQRDSNALGRANDKKKKEMKKEDWGNRYKKLGTEDPKDGTYPDINKSQEDVNEFWNDYWREEWGNNAEKVKELGEAFILELLNLGFYEKTNPFIGFVRIALKLGLEIDNKQYGTLHNAFIDRDLSDRDLRGKGSFGRDNIIFCKDFYEKEIRELPEYLEYQHQICDSYSGYYSGGKCDFGNSVLNSKYKSSPREFFKDLFYEGGNVLEKSNDRTSGKPLVDGKIRPLKHIIISLESCFGFGTEQKSNAEIDAKKLSKGVNTKDDALEIINFLLAKSLNVSNRKKIFKKFPTLNTGKIIIDANIDFSKLLGTEDIKPDKAMEIIEELCKKYSIN